MGANFIDEMRDNYLAHFGKKGQTWYVRNYQSYETVPTRSGKVGVEHIEKTGKNDKEPVIRVNNLGWKVKGPSNKKLDKFEKIKSKNYVKGLKYAKKHNIQSQASVDYYNEGEDKSRAYNSLDANKKKEADALYKKAKKYENEADRYYLDFDLNGNVESHSKYEKANNNYEKTRFEFEDILRNSDPDWNKTQNIRISEIRGSGLPTDNRDELKKRMKSASTGRKIARAIIPGLNYYDIAKTGSQMKKEGRFKSSNETSSTSGYTRKENEEELKRRMKSASTGRKIARAIIPGLNYYDIAKTGSQMKKEGRFKK